MAGHVHYPVATGVPIYICDPHFALATRIERERQRTPAPVHAQEHRPVTAQRSDLARFQRRLSNRGPVRLNGRPRKTFGSMKPSDKFAELLALTALPRWQAHE